MIIVIINSLSRLYCGWLHKFSYFIQFIMTRLSKGQAWPKISPYHTWAVKGPSMVEDKPLPYPHICKSLVVITVRINVVT